MRYSSVNIGVEVPGGRECMKPRFWMKEGEKKKERQKDEMKWMCINKEKERKIEGWREKEGGRGREGGREGEEEG